MKIYNTQTRTKEEFIPLTPGKVGIYACGPTVYNYIHIGNARPLVVFDTLRRYLEHKGYEVTFVQNFTDIDDKMINRANDEGTTVAALAKRFIAEYWVDAGGLNVRPATVQPRATEHIREIIALVKGLVDKGLAYPAPDGVYYDTQAFDGYGKLSGQVTEDLEAGARIEVDENKRHPMDFALWKKEKPGEPSWGSPWGKGRPGWHIECSAMAMKYLGETFDIHCGGQDLVFPHHENEVAQSEGFTGKPFARYWMHNGYLKVNNVKMSKSLGNFFTVREIAEQYDLEAVRFFLLSAQYRSPLNFSAEQVAQAAAALSRIETARDNLAFAAERQAEGVVSPEVAGLIDKLEADFDEAMDDDLNTADAIGAIFEFIREINIRVAAGITRQSAARALAALKAACAILGVAQREKVVIPDEVRLLADERAKARAGKDWAASDRLRDQIQALGFSVEDTREGQKIGKL